MSRFLSGLLLTGVFVMPQLDAATEPSSPAVPQASRVEPDVSAWLQQLGDEDFKTREKATQELWKTGAKALPELRKLQTSPDPEIAMRAQELVRKIELDVFPDSNPELIELIERYPTSAPADKGRILTKLRTMKAWRQILRLYAGDDDKAVRLANAQVIHQIALLAAREEMIAGRQSAARELLELAPAENPSLLALAEFHRLNGTLEQEIKLAKERNDKAAAAWRLALYRVDGNLKAAASEALAADEPRLAALYSAMLGDPLPWLKLAGQDQNDWNSNIQQIYARHAIQRWSGMDRQMNPNDSNLLKRAVGQNGGRSQGSARNALFLLGMHEAAESSLAKYSVVEAFWHLYSFEKNDEALALIGVDPAKPFERQWVEKRMAMHDKLAMDEDSNHGPVDELVTLATFMEMRGMRDKVVELYGPPLLELAAKDEDAFLDILRNFANGASVGGSAIHLAKTVGGSWAADKDERWTTLVQTIFGEQEIVSVWWQWMPELMPEAGKAERFEALLSLLGNGPDPKKLRESCMARAWKLHDQAKDDERRKLVNRIGEWAFVVGNAEHGCRALDLMDEQGRATIYWGRQMTHLSAAGRWKDVADTILVPLRRVDENEGMATVELQAYAAASLRKAGRLEEAAKYDGLVDRLVLGEASAASGVANGYAFAGDQERANLWLNRAMMLVDPEDEAFVDLATRWCDSLLDQKERWLDLAAVGEVICARYNHPDNQWERPIGLMRARMKADLFRALSFADDNRSRCLKLLDEVHANHITDGSLADFFFPALRVAGIGREHYEDWFNRSWEAYQKVIERYPESINTRNTAAWLAARAQLRLDEAEDHLRHVFKFYPRQAAYLDTMAEIQFARGIRKDAVKWSNMAMLFSPDDNELRKQNRHFLEDPLPSRK